MSRFISWIDPRRWNELLEQAGLPSVELEAGRTEEARGHRATAWLERLLERGAALPQAHGAFVVDRHGALLAQAGLEAGELAAVAADLVEVFEARRRRGEGGRQGMAIFSLAGTRRLHLIEAESPAGRFALGVVADRSLNDGELLELQLRLGQALR